MTDNTSVSDTEPLAVTDCRECRDGWWFTRRYRFQRNYFRQVVYENHCATCHVNDKHSACESCGACLPDYHRTDQRFCSSTCRVAGMKQRQQARVEYEEWRHTNPDEAAELDKHVAVLNGMDELIARTDPDLARDKRRRQKDIERTLARRVPCAGGCGRLVQPAPEYRWENYRRVKVDEPVSCRKCSTEPIRCPECHREFMPSRSDARYCTAVCRQRAYRSRRRSSEPAGGALSP